MQQINELTTEIADQVVGMAYMEGSDDPHGILNSSEYDQELHELHTPRDYDERELNDRDGTLNFHSEEMDLITNSLLENSAGIEHLIGDKNISKIMAS